MIATLRRAANALGRVAVAAVIVPGLALLSASSLAAQLPTAAPVVNRLAIVVADRRVYIYTPRIPSEREGWIISRDGVPLTREPMTGVLGPAEFAAAIGPDLELVQRITSTESSLGAYRRLRAGGTAGGIAQVLSPPTAAALGALYVDSTATAGATHSYTAVLTRLARPDSVLLRAVGSVRVVTMAVRAPGAPTARAGDGTIKLAWTPPRFTGATDDIVVAYTVERADSTGQFERISPIPVMRVAEGQSGFSDDALAPGQLYRYRIRAADLIGRLSEPSAAVTVRAPVDRGPLPPPQLAADVSDGRVRVVWTLSPEPQTRGYHVERAVGGDSVYRRINRALVPAELPEFIDTLARGREIYSYRVRAVDGAGRIGAPSNPTTTRGMDARPPAAPTALVAAPLPNHRVRLTWRAPPDGDVRGYEVHRTEQRDTLFARIGAVMTNVTFYVDSGYDGNTLEPGREYGWRIVAVDSSGNNSAPAEVHYRIVDDEAPAPVTSLLLHNQLGRHVEITWTASPSNDVARYVVERVAGTAPATVGATVGATVVATVASRGRLFVRDTTPVRGQLATWRVVALDSVGNRSTSLADTLTFRDLTRPPAPRRVTAIRTAGVTTVQWERVVSSDLRGYIVYRAERSDGPRTRLTPTPIATLQFVDRSGLALARYVVRAVDAAGNESDESPVVVVVDRR